MIKKKNNISLKIIFYIEIFSLLGFINSLSFHLLKGAQQNENSEKSTILKFNISGGIDDGFNEDKHFKIRIEVYKEYQLLTEQFVDCTIPKMPNAKFGESIYTLCEADLKSSPDAEDIKFLEFIPKEDDLNIIDNKKYVLGKTLILQKKQMDPDVEFVAQSVKTIKCVENKFIFGIRGEINKYWIDSFDFNIELNNHFTNKVKCTCPNVYFNSDITINCTITASREDNIIFSLSNGLEIKEHLYKVVNSKNETKLFKLKVKNNSDKLEFTGFNCNPTYDEKEDRKRDSRNDDEEYNNRKSNRGNQYQNEDNYNNRNKKDEEDNQSRWEREREQERRRKKEQEEREREEEKRKKDEEDLAKLLRDREKQKEEKERRNRFEINQEYNENPRRQRNDDDNYNYNRRNFDNNDDIDYNSNVKLIHIQVRYSHEFIYYLFYALSPVPLGHKIKARFTVTKYNYNTGYNDQENKYIVLKTEEEVNKDNRNIVIEYVARYDCEKCDKLVLDRNNIQGAKIYNLPEDLYLLDAIATNKRNYLQKNQIQSPPLYITENIFTQNCMVILGGNFFNKNRFFPSKVPLNLISTGGYYGNSRNVTVYCGLNERGIFSCPINDNLNNFEFRLEQFIIDQRENIIIDNSYIGGGMGSRVTCQRGPLVTVKVEDKTKPSKSDGLFKNKNINWKKLFFGIIIIYVLYYIISKFCCQKEEEYSDEYNSRWRVSSSSYGGGGETRGLRNRW